MNKIWRAFAAILFFSFLSGSTFNCSIDLGGNYNQKHPLNTSETPQTITATDKSIRWYQANTNKKTNGVALVIHGLNLRPEKMEAIITILTDSGIDVLNLSLRGHGCNYSDNGNHANPKLRIETFKTVSYQVWIEETYRAYHLAKKRSKQKRVPLFFLGFSLGGLMGADLFAVHMDVHFDRMVLFAPALNLYGIYYAAKLFSPLPNLVIPSLAPKSYRDNDSTPVAAYNALFDTIEHFRENPNSRLNTPTLVFIAEKDELVSYSKLKRLVENEGLNQWKFHLIYKGKDAAKGMMHHLIIDEPSVGETVWKEIREAMLKHLLQ
jgi:alpha-beta hydrolase superfamily lysophospholipase